MDGDGTDEERAAVNSSRVDALAHVEGPAQTTNTVSALTHETTNLGPG